MNGKQITIFLFIADAILQLITLVKTKLRTKMDFYKVQEEILKAKMRKKCLQLSNILVKAETFLSVVSNFFFVKS